MKATKISNVYLVINHSLVQKIWGDTSIQLTAVHEDHKDYKCEDCGKSFSEAGSLKKHIYTVHEGHKDYKCEDCGKSFTQSQSLEIHLHTVHDGFKDHKCESCGKTFSQPQSLKKHIHIVHEGKKRLQMWLVVSHSLNHTLWRNTFAQFMNDYKNHK